MRGAAAAAKRLDTLSVARFCFMWVRIISKIPSGCPPPLAQRLEAVPASLVIQLAIGAILGASTVARRGGCAGGRLHHFGTGGRLRSEAIALGAVSVIVDGATRDGRRAAVALRLEGGGLCRDYVIELLLVELIIIGHFIIRVGLFAAVICIIFLGGRALLLADTVRLLQQALAEVIVGNRRGGARGRGIGCDRGGRHRRRDRNIRCDELVLALETTNDKRVEDDDGQ